MAHAILMPKPGQMTEQCSIVEWHKQEGDVVHRGDRLFEIETDKSVMDVEAFDNGVLLKILVPAGQSVPVNTVCAYVGEAGETLPEAPAPSDAIAPTPSASSVPTEVVKPTPPSADSVTAPPAQLAGSTRVTATRIAISPRASQRAAEAGVDPRTLTGTGPEGRIVERDVQAAIAGTAVPEAPAPAPARPMVAVHGEAPARPLSRLRRVIADRLAASWTATPHFTVTVAVDMSNLLAFRAEQKAAGLSLTVTDFVLAATAHTLAEYPDVNSRTDGVSVWQRTGVHLGMAVSVPAGLVVPVIRDADRLTLGQIHDRAALLAAAARAGTSSVDDLSGGTFTVSNLGMFGVEEFSAIINPGEAAILAVSAAIPTPVAVDGVVAIRPIMKLTLSADHRLLDGAIGARFLGALKTRLQDAGSFEVSAPQNRPAPDAPAGLKRIDGPDSFDVVVLGAGTGGYTAAFRAAQFGMKVALVDADRIGGTCLHRGCIPTKVILESAALAHRMREDGRRLGVTATDISVDYGAVVRNKDQVVQRLWTGLAGLVDANRVEWVSGRGSLDGPGRVRVQLNGSDGAAGAGGERVLSATNVILATGSRARSLPGIVSDGQRILTSDDVLRMKDLPSSIIIIGAGAVGAEFASAFHDLGVTVTLIEFLPAILPLEDRDVSRELERTFTRRGIAVITNARFEMASLIVDETGVRLTVGPDGTPPAELQADCVLIATGRAANVEDIGLETTSVRTAGGVIEVDAYMQTADPHVYAIGDVVGGLWLAHTAAHEGLIAVHAIARDPSVRAIDYVRQPRGTYTRPEVASIGLTEQACQDRGLSVAIGQVPFAAIAKAVIEGQTDGFAKIITHRETGELLGLHIVGPHATELIAEGALAATLDVAADAMGVATHAHPTLSEVIGEAASALRGRSINFSSASRTMGLEAREPAATVS